MTANALQRQVEHVDLPRESRLPKLLMKLQDVAGALATSQQFCYDICRLPIVMLPGVFLGEHTNQGLSDEQQTDVLSCLLWQEGFKARGICWSI